MHRSLFISVPVATRLTAARGTRSYVGLSFNFKRFQKQPTEPTTAHNVDRSLDSFQPTTIHKSSISSSISSVGDDTASPEEMKAEPSFEVISPGVGSALLIKMPPETEIIAATGTAVGSSSKVSSKLALDDSTVKAIGKKLVGDAMFFQKYATKSTAGDLLLAPTRMGEIAVIQLKGSTKYVLRRDAFLAKTDKVTLNLALDNIKSWDTGIVNKLVHMVSGPGTIAISHYGGLYRVNMAAGEEYLANPRNLIMWDRRTFPTRLNPSNPVIPSPRSPLRRYTVVRNIVDSPSLQPKLQYLHRIVQGLRNYILGAPDLVKLKGPGDFYLASRVEPFFEKSRLLNAVAAANDSTAQIFEQAGLFPSPAASASETASVAPKSKPHPGYANEKSVNGKPSYYAEIGNDGHVEFVSKARK